MSMQSSTQRTTDTGASVIRTIVPANRVVALQTPLELGGQGTARNRIEVQREGNRVTAIHVFCKCGEQIVLHCDLNSPDDPNTSAL